MNDTPPSRYVLADDHAVYRMGLKALIERDGKSVVVGEAGSAEETIEVVARTQPDVLVLDVHMKDLMGTEVLRQLREGGSQVRVLMLSAHDDLVYVEEAARLGASGFVTKDRSPVRIVEAARQVAEGEEVWLVRQPLGSPLFKLTSRDRDILRLLAQGLSNDKIAEALYLSEHTVRNHLTILYEKIGVATAREAIAWAWRHRLVG